KVRCAELYVPDPRCLEVALLRRLERQTGNKAGIAESRIFVRSNSGVEKTRVMDLGNARPQQLCFCQSPRDYLADGSRCELCATVTRDAFSFVQKNVEALLLLLRQRILVALAKKIERRPVGNKNRFVSLNGQTEEHGKVEFDQTELIGIGRDSGAQSISVNIEDDIGIPIRGMERLTDKS